MRFPIHRLAGMLLLLPCLIPSAWSAPNPPMLRYAEPAQEWSEALPIGNGRLGAMVFGKFDEERIQFNEDTLWMGEPHDYANPEGAQYLPAIQKAVFEGRQGEAGQLIREHFLSRPLRQLPYQPFGNIWLKFPGAQAPSGYERLLDMDQGVASVKYKIGDVTYTREAFASHPANAIIVRLSADKPGSVSFTVKLDSPNVGFSTTATATNRLALAGRVRDYIPQTRHRVSNPLRFEAQLLMLPQGGKVTGQPNALEVANADAVTLVLVAATNYVKYEDTSGDPHAKCEAMLKAVDASDFDKLRLAHVTDFRSLFRRVSIDLGTTPKEVADQPLIRRIKSFDRANDPELPALYFQYGRYLLISCSRPGSQPANLQGIWNELLDPPWESKYTTNINAQMNYWPAEQTNLSECALPLFDMIDELVKSGSRTAKNLYNARGWVVHHNTDLWRGTAPINNAADGCYPCGGAWLCQHYWWHYQYTGDKQFLNDRAYPAMKQAALFMVDFLVEDPRHPEHWLVTNPSYSPEQGGLVAGPAMDSQIIRDLFRNTIEASKILDVDPEFRATLQEKLKRLPPDHVGSWGQLMEWLDPNPLDNPDNKHRHNSHLWAVFPGDEINRNTPDLFKAARISLEHRTYGRGDTGWSMAWKVNLWAQFGEGDTALDCFQSQVRQRTLPNMFDLCGPFQIDGNFGGASGIAQMLLQSDAGEVALLPALPSVWPKGAVTGLRGRGGLTVDIRWEGGKASGATLKADRDGSIHLVAPKGQAIDAVRSSGQAIKLSTTDTGAILLPVKQGATYEVSFKAA